MVAAAMATSTVEDYIKSIYALQFDKRQGGNVGMGELAAALGVAPGTATSMVKSLAKSGHLSYKPRIGVKLTEQGEKLALHVLRRHRLIELFLVKTLGMEWHEIHDEAEALEHSISDRLLEKIDALLGRPKLDPHGDPIPSATGDMTQRDLIPLDQCEEGQEARIGRIEDQEGSFLQYLESNDLTPGILLRINAMDPHAGVLSVKFDNGVERSLSYPAARKIHVERCG